MAYFEFNGEAPQTQTVRRLKHALLLAKELSEQAQAQNANMTLAQMQAQFGLPTAASETDWENLINAIVTAVNATAVTNFTTQVGFTT